MADEGATVERQRPLQSYYDDIKTRFAEARDLRLGYRPQGTSQYTSDFSGALARYAGDPHADQVPERAADRRPEVEVLFIGGGFSALLTAARLRERGLKSIRIVERGADVGGTWYWNRYPGAACDVPAYDYLPLLDEMEYVPSRLYARARKSSPTARRSPSATTSMSWPCSGTTVESRRPGTRPTKRWLVETDRGDAMTAQFVICANGTLSKPKLSKIAGMESFAGHSFHTSRWDYAYTGEDLEKLSDKVVGIIGTGASAVQAIPRLGKTAKQLYVFQRTPSGIDIRGDRPTDPAWAARLEPGWQQSRRMKHIRGRPEDLERAAELSKVSREEKIRRQENSNIDHMMRIHARIDEMVHRQGDRQRAEALVHVHVQAGRASTTTTCRPTTSPSVHLVDTKGQGHHRDRA